MQAKTERLLNVQVTKGDSEEFKDSVTSQPVVPELVREARRKELEYFESMKVWIRKSRTDAFKHMADGLTSTRVTTRTLSTEVAW